MLTNMDMVAWTSFCVFYPFHSLQDVQHVKRVGKPLASHLEPNKFASNPDANVRLL